MDNVKCDDTLGVVTLWLLMRDDIYKVYLDDLVTENIKTDIGIKYAP